MFQRLAFLYKRCKTHYVLKKIIRHMNTVLLIIGDVFKGWPNIKIINLRHASKWTTPRKSPGYAQIIVHGCPFSCACNVLIFKKGFHKKNHFKIMSSIVFRITDYNIYRDAEESNPYETRPTIFIEIWLFSLLPVEKEYDSKTRHIPIRHFFHYIPYGLCHGDFSTVPINGDVHRHILGIAKDTGCL